MTATPSTPTAVSGRYAWYVLGLLFFVYVLNFLDRILIVSLFTSLKNEFSFSTFQVTLLGSTAFVLFYTVLGLPFGLLADRVHRVRMIVIGLALWSIASGCSGFATNFAQLFACRLLVGVGEATLGPAALSILSDYFLPRQRATVQAIYSSAIAFGSGMAFFLGTAIDEAYGWRWAFFLVGFPGVLVAALVWLTLREPTRGILEKAVTDLKKVLRPDWKTVFRMPVILYHNAGYAFYAIAANSLSMVVPLYLIETRAIPKTTVSYWLTLFILIGGLGGTILGGRIADVFKKRRRGGRLLFTALLTVLCVPLWLLLLFVEAPAVLYPVYFLLVSTSLVWLGPAAADVHDIVGPDLRGIGIGLYFFVVNIIGYGIGQPLIGYLSDTFKASGVPNYFSFALLVSPVALFISGLLLWRAAVLHEKAT